MKLRGRISVSAVLCGFLAASSSSVSGQETPPFLSFPLPGRGQLSAIINSVFDHSMPQQYCRDDVVVAYTGEEGRREFGVSNFDVNFGCGILQGFKNRQGTNFTLGDADYGGGTQGSEFLSYDGHPGYDYRTRSEQDPEGRIDVLAAAPGTVACISLRVANGANMDREDNNEEDCGEGRSQGELKIDHGNGYFTIYLHLSSVRDEIHGPRDGLPGTQVSGGQIIATSGDTGVSGRPHLHFEVRRNINGVLVPVDPYGWRGTGTDPYAIRATNENLWLRSIRGDLNKDLVVNALDWSIMASLWLTADPVADLNRDGIVNSIDFSIMNANWRRRVDLIID